MAERVLWQQNLTLPLPELSTPASRPSCGQLWPESLGTSSGSRVSHPRAAVVSHAGSQTAAASCLLHTPVPEEVRIGGQLENRAAGDARKSKTCCRKGHKKRAKEGRDHKRKAINGHGLFTGRIDSYYTHK